MYKKHQNFTSYLLLSASFLQGCCNTSFEFFMKNSKKGRSSGNEASNENIRHIEDIDSIWYSQINVIENTSENDVVERLPKRKKGKKLFYNNMSAVTIKDERKVLPEHYFNTTDISLDNPKPSALQDNSQVGQLNSELVDTSASEEGSCGTMSYRKVACIATSVGLCASVVTFLATYFILKNDFSATVSELYSCNRNNTDLGNQLNSCMLNLNNCANASINGSSNISICNINLNNCVNSLNSCSSSLANYTSSLSACTLNLGICNVDLNASYANATTCISGWNTCTLALNNALSNSSTYAASLVTCTSDLNAALSNSSTCAASLVTCTSDFNAALSNSSTCAASLGTCTSSLSNCTASSANSSTCCLMVTNLMGYICYGVLPSPCYGSSIAGFAGNCSGY